MLCVIFIRKIEKPALRILYLVLKDFLRFDSLDSILDNHIGKIAYHYHSGMLDLQTKSFRYGLLKSDYLTSTLFQSEAHTPKLL